MRNSYANCSGLEPAARPISPARKSGVVAVCSVAIALVLAACSNSDRKSAQSLAKVGDTEITVHQLNDELGRLDKVTDKTRKEVLESLIDRQLLQSEAERNKVDRDPEVVQAMERAKSQILAEAYLKTRLTKIAPPTRQEIELYYSQHPELFAKRQSFDTRELVIATKDSSTELESFAKTAKSVESIEQWLLKHGVSFVRKQGVTSAMELPPALLTRLQTIQKGDLFAVRTPDQLILGQLIDVRDNPVSLPAVEKQIGQFLVNRKRQEIVAEEMKRLRTTVTIAYLTKSPEVAATATSASGTAQQ